MRAVVRAAAIAVVAAVGGLCVSGSLQQDFAALWVAGRAAARGLDPYLNHVGGAERLWDGVGVFRHSRFLYPPLVAHLLRPLAAWPYFTAKIAFTAAAVAACIGVLRASVRAAGIAGSAREGAAYLGGALFLPLALHLERGQVDIFVVLLFLFAVVPGRRDPIGGGALAFAVMLKPAALVAVPFLLLLRRTRLLAWTAAGGVVLALLTVATVGPARSRAYVVDVLPRVALYGESGTSEMLLPGDKILPLAADLEAGEAVVDGRRYRLSPIEFPVSASLPRLLAPSGPRRWAFVIPILLLGAGLALAVRRARSAPPPAPQIAVAAALLLSVVGSPTGWAMGGVAALPLAAAALAAGASQIGRGFLVAAFVLCSLPGLVPGNFAFGLLAALCGAAAALATRRMA